MAMVEKQLATNIPSFRGSMSEEDDPSFSVEDEEVDETFVALQKMLRALNRTNRANRIHHSSNHGSFTNGNSNAVVMSGSESTSQQRMSREEMLESRRQERDRFRRSLFTRSNNSNDYNACLRHTCPAYYCSEEEEEESTGEPSVESAISSRLIHGTFSNLNVHVISRSRWSAEDRVIERFPIVMLPKNGKISIPTDNKKVSVVQTNEFMELRKNLVENLPPDSAPMNYLTPPRSTWYMQMHDFEEHKYKYNTQ